MTKGAEPSTHRHLWLVEGSAPFVMSDHAVTAGYRVLWLARATLAITLSLRSHSALTDPVGVRPENQETCGIKVDFDFKSGMSTHIAACRDLDFLPVQVKEILQG